ncbi:hypothetical protein Tco_1368688 [Tanacetum coccineum]
MKSDFLPFEEADAFIAIDDRTISPIFMQRITTPRVHSSFLEQFSTMIHFTLTPNHGEYLPELQKDLKVVEPQKSSVEYATSYEPKVEIPEVELKELPPHLEMLKRCEDTKLALNWEKSHFMVKEGIVLGHKISRKGIEVDKAKVDVISKLPHPTTVKGIRSFLG